MQSTLRILFLNDRPGEMRQMTDLIRTIGHETRFMRVADEAALTAALTGQNWDIIISDLDLAGCLPDRVLAIAVDRQIDAPVIVLGSELDFSEAAALLNAGAVDCIPKSSLERLPLAVYRELQRKDKLRDINADLQMRETRFLSLFNNMAEGVALHELIFDAHGKAIDYRILDCNSQFENILHIKRDDAIGKIATDLYGVPNAPYLEEYVACVQSQSPSYFDTYTPAMNKYFSISVTPWGENGFATIFSDTTGHQLALAALRESELRWQYALEGAGDGLWDWNAVTGEVYFSRQWKNMLGYAEDEITNSVNEWDKRIHPDDRDEVYRLLNQHLSGESPAYSSEHRLLTKNGTYKWVLDRGQVISWTEEGQPLRVIGTHSDISARKSAEEERDRLSLLLNNIVDSMPSIIIAIDKQGLVTRWNAEAARQSGLTAEQALGRPIAEALPLFADQMEHLQHALDDHLVEREDRVVSQTNEGNRYSEIMIYPLVINQVEGAVVRVDDITDKVVLQEMMIQNEKMMSVGGLAAGMAHELNNPLGGTSYFIIAHRHQGQMTVKSQPGQGTTVAIRLPVGDGTGQANQEVFN